MKNYTLYAQKAQGLLKMALTKEQILAHDVINQAWQMGIYIRSLTLNHQIDKDLIDRLVKIEDLVKEHAK